MSFKNALGSQVLILDGAMGTMVQNLGLTDAAFGGPEFKMLTDLLVFSRPDELEGIHLEYLQAGANLIETDTFGASPLRLKEFNFSKFDPSDLKAIPDPLDLKTCSLESLTLQLNIEGCRIAHRAVEKYRAQSDYDGRPLLVAGSIGPSNYVVSSTQANLNKANFGQIVENFYYQVCGLIEGGADVLLIETQQDILETKAVIEGAKKAFAEKKTKLPIIVQVTVDVFSKMQIFNTDIHAAYTAVSGMGIDVFGINCNVGPDEMAATVEKLSRFCRHPISVVPNAGQPISEDGQTCYKLSPEDMANTMEPFVREHGVSIVGGCCGTTPAHIKTLREKLNGVVPAPREPDQKNICFGPARSSPY